MNTGNIIQNLGFLSTTLEEEIALCFKKNILYKIIVPKLSKDSKFYKGFAYLTKIS
jgi:hypothetical protein